MKFSGVQKISLIDFPDKMATVLFTPGCNLRCPFCHNWRIVINPRPPFLNQEKAIRMLEARKKFIDAVVITGGEPTLHRELPKLLKKLEKKDFRIKLDTNGFFPQTLKDSLPFVDYVALDVKTAPDKYCILGARDLVDFSRSVEMLKNAGVDHEFRTTVVPGFVDEEDMPKIAKIVDGGKRFVFQQFVPDDTLDKNFRNIEPYPREKILECAEQLKPYVGEVLLRV
ncbi:MAG: anaerobic ribonucleoside-triphosphate reductase activating protein [Candidatus Bathyarchaeota archaeon]|nr:anaerobic ribonucleoside-triphosphate reductase activating protein [Candidatus Bathyarchaeota archaeon]